MKYQRHFSGSKEFQPSFLKKMMMKGWIGVLDGAHLQVQSLNAPKSTIPRHRMLDFITKFEQ